MNEKLISDYKTFLDKGKTERECVKEIVALAKKHGFKDALSCKSIKAGDKIYITKMNKSVALYIIGTENIENGMNILGAHIDSPRLDVKPNPLYEKDFICYLNTHYYGGIKKYQWVTIPLAIHGVVCKTDGTTVEINIGENDDDPVFTITDILPHLAQDQMKDKASDFIPGENLDLIFGSVIPTKKTESEEETKSAKSKKEKTKKAKDIVLKLLKDKYNITEKDFLSAELEIVPAGKARDCGLDRSLVLAYGQDDRVCAYTSALALIESKAGKRTNCCLCVDKEEIGSVGATGMSSHFFENATAEILARMTDGYSDLTLRRCMANSFMLSSDVNAAFDPMNPGLYDKDNASVLGGGVVFNKYTGSRGKAGASDANPEFIAQIRAILDNDKISYQVAELGKVDQGGGGTIAHLAAKYGMNVIDAGVSVLSMHSPWELTSKEDICQAFECYKSFIKNL